MYDCAKIGRFRSKFDLKWSNLAQSNRTYREGTNDHGARILPEQMRQNSINPKIWFRSVHKIFVILTQDRQINEE